MLHRLPPPTLKRLLSWQERLNRSWEQVVLQRWYTLKRFQKLYLLAAIAVIIHIPTAVVLALSALVVDFWPRFTHAWESLAGKAIILVFYAAIANFALAASGSLVNDVTGLDASHFPYAHNTAILLSLPGWIFAISLATLVLMQLFFPFYIFLMLGLRAIGIRSTQIFKAIHYPVTTMCLRFALSILLLTQGVNFVSENEELQDTNTTLSTPHPAPTETDTIDNSAKKPPAFAFDDEAELIALKDGGYQSTLRQLLAYFIYYLEANSASRCELENGSRAVELNPYQYVEIRKDKSQPEGYLFTVKACKSPGISAP